MLQKPEASQKNLPKWGELNSAVDRRSAENSSSPALLERETGNDGYRYVECRDRGHFEIKFMRLSGCLSRIASFMLEQAARGVWARVHAGDLLRLGNQEGADMHGS